MRGEGILDTVVLCGKRKDAIVACPQFFLPEAKVRFGRFRELPDCGYDDLGNATVETVDLKTKIVKFDALPTGVRVGDVIMLYGDYFDHEVVCNPL